MPRVPGDDLFVVETAGVGKLARNFSKDERKVQNRINRAMRALDHIASPVYKRQAPVDTGLLRDSIRSVIFFRGKVVRISVRARAVRDGFNYLDVTRYGHRVTFVRPRRAKAMKVYLYGRSQGEWLPLKRVRGVVVRGDWVEEGHRDMDKAVTLMTRSLGREIQITLGRAR